MTGSSIQAKVGVGCLIYARNTKRYLFLLRDGEKFGGTWGLVGGKVEFGELTANALYREISEEINVDLSQAKTIPIETFTSSNRRFTYHTFVVTVDCEFMPELNSEHRGYCWVNLEDHPRPLHPGVWKTFKFRTVVDKITTLEKLL